MFTFWVKSLEMPRVLRKHIVLVQSKDLSFPRGENGQMCQSLHISTEYGNFGVAVDGSSSDERTGITTGSRDMVLLGRGREIGERELVPICSVSGEQSILSTRDFVFPVRPPPCPATYAHVSVSVCVHHAPYLYT